MSKPQAVAPVYCPHTAELGGNPEREYWLEGSLGGRHVHMYLRRGGEAVVGLFYDTTDWRPILLGGQWSTESGIDARGTSEGQDELGRLSAQFDGSRLAGIWKGMRGEEKVVLRPETEPACDGGGPRATFKNPRWPISFSYPATWHVAVGKSIILTCPDPSAMAYGSGSIEITQGEEASPGKNGALLHPIPTTKRAGMTILNADAHEWRLYCLGTGGYAGQGEGADRFVEFKGRWIRIVGFAPDVVARLVDSLVFAKVR